MKNTIERRLSVSAPIDRVWKALTDHQEFGTWFLAEIDKPFVLDSTVKCRSTYPGSEHLSWELTVIEMKEMSSFAFTWPAYYGEDADRDGTMDPHLTVKFELEAQGSGTLLRLTESGFDQLPPDYAPIALRMNEGGWDAQMKNIETHVNG